DYFKALVYTHTTSMPAHQKLLGAAEGPLRMGNFNPLRVPDPTLQEIFKYVRDEMGFRVTMRGRLGPAVMTGDGVTYPLTVQNDGVAGRGLVAEDITVALSLPPGVGIVGSTGVGYQGEQADQA